MCGVTDIFDGRASVCGCRLHNVTLVTTLVNMSLHVTLHNGVLGMGLHSVTLFNTLDSVAFMIVLHSVTLVTTLVNMSLHVTLYHVTHMHAQL